MSGAPGPPGAYGQGQWAQTYGNVDMSSWGPPPSQHTQWAQGGGYQDSGYGPQGNYRQQGDAWQNQWPQQQWPEQSQQYQQHAGGGAKGAPPAWQQHGKGAPGGSRDPQQHPPPPGDGLQQHQILAAYPDTFG